MITNPNTPSKRPSTQTPVTLPILAELTPRGDGTYVLKPRASPSDLDTWIPPKRAAQLIGIEPRSIYKLLDPAQPFLLCKRPLRGKCLVSLKSVWAYIQATNDPDFWDDQLQMDALKQSLRRAFDSLRGIVSQPPQSERWKFARQAH